MKIQQKVAKCLPWFNQRMLVHQEVMGKITHRVSLKIDEWLNIWIDHYRPFGSYLAKKAFGLALKLFKPSQKKFVTFSRNPKARLWSLKPFYDVYCNCGAVARDCIQSIKSSSCTILSLSKTWFRPPQLTEKGSETKWFSWYYGKSILK